MIESEINRVNTIGSTTKLLISLSYFLGFNKLSVIFYLQQIQSPLIEIGEISF